MIDLTSRIVIGDKTLQSGSGGDFLHYDPARGRPNATVALAGPDEAADAVTAAQDAFAAWRRTSPKRRRDLILALSDALLARTDELAAIAAAENGLPRRGFDKRLGLSVDWIRYYAGWADKVGGQLSASHPAENMEYVLYEPYGVVAIIITWNSPLISLAMKVPAALAAGNTVVIKPSELTPFTPTVFAEVAAEVGFPPGVINVLPGGIPAGEALVADPRVGKVSFTGGIRAAQSMMAAGAPLLKPFCFELGGKSANLVFADADMKTAIDSVLISMGNAGQSCKFPSRVLIEDSVYEDVLDRLCAGLASLPVGDPSHESTIVGPLVTDQAQQRVLGMIEETRKNARLRLGGGRPKLPDDLRGGYFVEPTVLDEVDPQSPLAQEEVFGPVVAVFRFTSEEEAIELANSTPWGLSGYIQTTDLARAHRVAAELVTGTIHINGSNLANAAMPFGGYGISGLGREGGRPGLDEFLRTKSVSLP